MTMQYASPQIMLAAGFAVQDCMPRVMTLPEDGEYEAWQKTLRVFPFGFDCSCLSPQA